jgi:xanthine dehydrogenase YagS FAD-binding subunit
LARWRRFRGRSRRPNAFLEGKVLTDEVAAQAADLILRDAEPLAHNAYKVPLARALVRRALAKLVT